MAKCALTPFCRCERYIARFARDVQSIYLLYDWAEITLMRYQSVGRTYPCGGGFPQSENPSIINCFGKVVV